MIYIDPLAPLPLVRRRFPNGARFPASESSHMFADSFEELEATARVLGLHKKWRHDDHYDLTPARRAALLMLARDPAPTLLPPQFARGVREVTPLDLVNIRRARRTPPQPALRGLTNPTERALKLTDEDLQRAATEWKP